MFLCPLDTSSSNLSWQRDLAVPALCDVEIFYSVSYFFRNLDQRKVIPVTPVAESAGYPSTPRWSAFLPAAAFLGGLQLCLAPCLGFAGRMWEEVAYATWSSGLMSTFLTGVMLCGRADHRVGGSGVTKSACVGRASDRQQTY